MTGNKHEPTLLEKANSIHKRTWNGDKPDIEKIELAMAYFFGEVTANQVAKAIQMNVSNVMPRMGVALRQAIITGLVELKWTKGVK